MIGVSITNLAPVNSGGSTVTYRAASSEDCRDEIDLAVYELVLTHQDVITMGHTIGRPILPY